MTDRWTVAPIALDDAIVMRVTVLRADTPTKDARFVEDDWPGAVHLGAFDGDRLVGTSTWIPSAFAAEPGVPAVQLRGMATLTSHQGLGVGAALIGAGVEHARGMGASLVWANARDAALRFYAREGFEVVGDGFITRDTQLPHHVVVRYL
ncbi:MAG: GNAT family N-acetyltransferase [Ilumatobacteraceae bacterium]